MNMYKLYVPFFIAVSLSAMDQKGDIVDLGDLPSSKDYHSDSSDNRSSTHDSINEMMIENVLVEKHQDILKFIKKEIRTDVFKTLKHNRSQLIRCIINKKPVITPEEFLKKYGEIGLQKIDKFMELGTAFLHIVSDHLAQEKQKIEAKASLRLATLVSALKNCEQHVANKLHQSEIAVKGCFGKSKKIIIAQPKQQPNNVNVNPIKKGVRFDKISNKKNEGLNGESVLKALQKKHGTLFRCLPHACSREIVLKFMDQYPVMARQLVEAPSPSVQKRDIPLSSSTTQINSSTTQNQIVNVQTVENDLLQNQNVAQVYEQYQVLKGVLESCGINVDAIEESINQELQVLVNNLTSRLEELGNTIVQDLGVAIQTISTRCFAKTQPTVVTTSVVNNNNTNN